MSALYDLLAAPFVDFAFMRRALVACAALSLGCGPSACCWCCAA
jgi:zinc/manganese transport system permease protein